MSIPIVIGVTGHRNIAPEILYDLEKAVRHTLEKIKKDHPNSEVIMLNSLASGADTICAEAAVSLGIELVCPLPMETNEYEKDFSETQLVRYRRLLKNAKRSFIVPHTEPEAEGRDYAYRQAGIYVATHCHILLALWDGGEPVPGGCGTAETVSFALNGDYSAKNGAMTCRPCHVQVIRINTPRPGTDTSDACKTEYYGDSGLSGMILSRTEEFNELCSESSGTNDHTADALYSDADRLSLHFAEKYNRTLAVSAVLGTLISFSFLLYDEIELHLMLLLCGLLLSTGMLLIKKADKSKVHERFIEYRVLAECARVQKNLEYAGSSMNAADLFSWAQYDKIPWITSAMYAIDIFQRSTAVHSAEDFWIRDQLEYHSSASKGTAAKKKLSSGALSMIYRLDIIIYISAVIYEILCFAGILPDAELFRSVNKILIGTLSAGTLFISGYFGRLSLERQTDDHHSMERFYCMMLEKLRLNGQTEELLKMLAGEELAENFAWYSYRKEDRPGLDL